MTPKQKLRSLEKKMERIEKANVQVNFPFVSKHIIDIKKYSELQREHFYLKYEIEHCRTCGKKL